MVRRDGDKLLKSPDLRRWMHVVRNQYMFIGWSLQGSMLMQRSSLWVWNVEGDEVGNVRCTPLDGDLVHQLRELELDTELDQ